MGFILKDFFIHKFVGTFNILQRLLFIHLCNDLEIFLITKKVLVELCESPVCRNEILALHLIYSNILF